VGLFSRLCLWIILILAYVIGLSELRNFVLLEYPFTCAINVTMIIINIAVVTVLVVAVGIIIITIIISCIYGENFLLRYTVAKLVQKWCAVFGTRASITVSTWAHPGRGKSIPNPQDYFIIIYFKYSSVYALVSKDVYYDATWIACGLWWVLVAGSGEHHNDILASMQYENCIG
jgi:hypothetical protein